jgi:hypothetical protein
MLVGMVSGGQAAATTREKISPYASQNLTGCFPRPAKALLDRSEKSQDMVPATLAAVQTRTKASSEAFLFLCRTLRLSFNICHLSLV